MLIHQVLDDILRRRWGENGLMKYGFSKTTKKGVSVTAELVVHLQTLVFNLHKYQGGSGEVYDVVTEMLTDYLEYIKITINDGNRETTTTITPEVSDELGEVWWGTWRAVMESGDTVRMVDRVHVTRFVFGILIEDAERIVDLVTEFRLDDVIGKYMLKRLKRNGCDGIKGDKNVVLCREIYSEKREKMFYLITFAGHYIVKITKSHTNKRKWLAYIYEPEWIKRVDYI